MNCKGFPRLFVIAYTFVVNPPRVRPVSSPDVRFLGYLFYVNELLSLCCQASAYSHPPRPAQLKQPPSCTPCFVHVQNHVYILLDEANRSGKSLDRISVLSQ